MIHLAGENVAQRWSDDAKQKIRASREVGTRNLVAGLRAAEPRPAALIASSAVGYYGKHGDERVGEDTPPGDDFLAVESSMLQIRTACRPLGLFTTSQTARAPSEAVSKPARRRQVTCRRTSGKSSSGAIKP